MSNSGRGPYIDGVGEEMSVEEVREMLEIQILDRWSTDYKDLNVTMHRDGGATIELELREKHVKGICQTW